MIDVHPAIVLLGGLVVVLLGAELLLRGAKAVAARLKMNPVVIGLTIVTIGTTAPELAVGITAATQGKGALAVGNIAGTNTLNILLILGLSAAIRALPIRLRSIKLDVPVMIASAAALLLMSLDGVLTRTEGGLLAIAAVLYTAFLVRESRREGAAVRREYAAQFGLKAAPLTRRGALAWYLALLLAGIALTVLGADLLVAGAVNLAQVYGVSDAVIGLTIVANGTSAPELATTVVATLKNDRDVAIGNLIGSSIYNVLVILGVTMLVSPEDIDVQSDLLWIDLPLMAVVAAACLPVFRSGNRVSRLEGALFVTAYLTYLTSLLAWRT